MISKQYLHTAQALLRITKSITDAAIANRLMALAADYERRARKADLTEAAGVRTADHAGSLPSN